MTSVLNRGVDNFVGYVYDTHADDLDMATLADGSYVVVWSSSNVYGNGVYIQRYGANGLAIGATLSVDSSSNVETHPSVTALPNGGYSISYLSGSTNNLLTRVYTADGVAYSSYSGILADQTASATLANGAHAAAYSVVAGHGSLSAGIYLDIFGVPNGWHYAIAVNTSGNAAIDPAVAGLDNGDIVVVWTEVVPDTGASNVCSRLFDSSGLALGAASSLEIATASNRTAPAVVALAGGYVVTWQEDAGGGDHNIYGQLMDDSGQAVGGEFLISANTALDQTTPSIAGLDDGGFVVAWTAKDNDGTGLNVYARHFDADGQPMGVEERVNTVTAGDQDVANVTALAGGGYVIAWSDEAREIISSRTFAAATTLNGSQVLYGTSGADTLDGGSGSDVMYGGSGDDTYFVDIAGDKVNEDVSGGDDTVMSGISYALGANIENLTLNGSAALSGTGNALDNVIVGNNGANHLNGGAGDDTINGGNGNDVIYASDGTDFASGDSGIDTYDASTGLGAVKLNLAAKSNQNGHTTYLEGFENVIGTAFADSIAGTSGDNVINGGAGADVMSGGLGDDTYYVDDSADKVAESSDATLGGVDLVISSVSFTLGSYIENLTLTVDALVGNGNALDNILTGNSGNNALDGKAGNDTLIGGLGDDTYVVDVVGDTIVEFAGQGNDTVKAGVTYALGANVDNLILTGTGNFSATGNADVNSLTGNSGNNVLDGGAGADLMAGGLGDDTYIVDNVGDVVNDFNGAGNDTILSSVTYSLNSRYVETLQLTGSANINAQGNNQNNILIGNIGNNALSGGAGADTFAFQLNSHADIITDFKASENDTINVSAYHATAHTVIQSGTSVIIDFGGGNTVTVLKTTIADVTAHTVF